MFHTISTVVLQYLIAVRRNQLRETPLFFTRPSASRNTPNQLALVFPKCQPYSHLAPLRYLFVQITTPVVNYCVIIELIPSHQTCSTRYSLLSPFRTHLLTLPPRYQQEFNQRIHILKNQLTIRQRKVEKHHMYIVHKL